MTSKNKAKQIYNECLNKIQGLEGTEWWESAKQCALIAANEMLDFLTVRLEWDATYSGDVQYWQEVKEEINLL